MSSRLGGESIFDSTEVGSKIEIHNSDRSVFRGCRRAWDWGSQMRMGLQVLEGEVNPHLWFGSGFHYAMEDQFGYKEHDSLYDALVWYTRHFKIEHRPENWQELLELGKGMFGHFERWQRNRERFETVWIDGKPLVELEFRLDIDPSLVGGREGVSYVGVIDRIVRTENGELWLLDYKTTSSITTAKLIFDPQVSSYVLAAQRIFNLPIEGLIFFQFRKDVPHMPKLLSSTGAFSVDKKALTTYDLFMESLTALYGGDPWSSGLPVPDTYKPYLDHLLSFEQPDGDRFIQFDKVRRNSAQLEATYEHIIMEINEMLDPELMLYPNHTERCGGCRFAEPCIARDDGSDYEFILQDNYVRVPVEDRAAWRRNKLFNL